MKSPRIDSAKLRESVRGVSCLLNVAGACLYQVSDPTVVPCHAPSEGKGAGVKSGDLWCVSGCLRCHDVLDRRVVYSLTGKHITRDEAAWYWLRGVQRQQQAWVDSGLLEVA